TGNPIANVRLETSSPFNSSLMLGGLSAFGYSQAYNVYTNAAGDATLWLFPTCSSCSYSISAYPPSGSNLATTTQSGITFTSDTAVTVIIQEAVVLSGRVLDPLGNGLPGQEVFLAPWAGGAQT